MLKQQLGVFVCNVAGGTDLQVITCMQVQPSQVGSTQYVVCVISFIRLPLFSHVTLKSWEEPRYEAKFFNVSLFIYSIQHKLKYWEWPGDKKAISHAIKTDYLYHH